MPMIGFDLFFKAATGHAPYDYQRRLAARVSGLPSASLLFSVLTGLGKTAVLSITCRYEHFRKQHHH